MLAYILPLWFVWSQANLGYKRRQERERETPASDLRCLYPGWNDSGLLWEKCKWSLFELCIAVWVVFNGIATKMSYQQPWYHEERLWWSPDISSSAKLIHSSQLIDRVPWNVIQNPSEELLMFQETIRSEFQFVQCLDVPLRQPLPLLSFVLPGKCHHAYELNEYHFLTENEHMTQVMWCVLWLVTCLGPICITGKIFTCRTFIRLKSMNGHYLNYV